MQLVNASAISCTDLAGRNRRLADDFAEAMRPIVFALMVEGIKGPTALADALNRQAITTRLGNRWQKVTVHRLLRRLGPSLLADVKAAQAIAMSEAMKAFGLG